MKDVKDEERWCFLFPPFHMHFKIKHIIIYNLPYFLCDFNNYSTLKSTMLWNFVFSVEILHASRNFDEILKKFHKNRGTKAIEIRSYYFCSAQQSCK